MLRKHRDLLISVVVGVLLVSGAKGQQPLNDADSKRIAHLLDTDRSPDLLQCTIQPVKPMLDFAFRLDVGYIVTCPSLQFEGHASNVAIFARVTPEGGKPLMLGQGYDLFVVPAKSSIHQDNIQMSGGFAAGEGKYQVEVLVGDKETGRTSRKSWSVRVKRSHQQRAEQVAIPPGTIFPLGVRPWPIKTDTTGKGLRVTVLLNAAPASPWVTRLRAWDRTFLVESLSSLLKQIPCASVRLRAFNLQQQVELFRQDQFDDAGFTKLEDALEKLELGTISYQALQQRRRWLDMLMGYAREELIAATPSDVVIFLGPWRYFGGEIPRDQIPTHETPEPRFYYFEYFPYWLRSHPPDALGTLTKGLDGTIYEMNSPADLVHSVQKMLAKVENRNK